MIDIISPDRLQTLTLGSMLIYGIQLKLTSYMNCLIIYDEDFATLIKKCWSISILFFNL